MSTDPETGLVLEESPPEMSPAGEPRFSHPSDQRLTRKPMAWWDRVKFLVLGILLLGFLVWNTFVQNQGPSAVTGDPVGISVRNAIQQTISGNIWLLVLSFTLSQMGQRSVMSVFWAIPPMLLSGPGAAAGIALINAIGNLGGFFGPSMMGTLRDLTGGYNGGLLVLAGALLIEAALVMTLRLPAVAGSRTSTVARSA